MISTAELSEKTFTGVELPDPFGTVLGKVPENFSMVIWGVAGSGKSTLAVALAVILAEKMGKGIICSSEEGAGPSMQNKIRRLNAEHANLFVKDFDGMDDLVAAIRYSGAAFVIFDSPSMSHIKTADMEQALDAAKKQGVAFIYILHATKTGDVKGNSMLIHKPDIELEVSEDVAKTNKNRFAETPQEFDVAFDRTENENNDFEQTGRKNPSIKIDSEFFGDYNNVDELRKKASDFAKNNLAGTAVTNIDSGLKVTITWQGLKKAVSGNTVREKLLSVPAIPEMIKNGKFLCKEPDRKGRNTIKAVHKFTTDVDFSGEQRQGFILVRETTGGNFFYDHFIIKKEPDGTSGERNNRSDSIQPSSGSNGKDKKSDKKKKSAAKPVNKPKKSKNAPMARKNKTQTKPDFSSITPQQLRRSKAQFKTARAAWKAIEENTGLRPANVSPDHTDKSWRWKIKKKLLDRGNPAELRDNRMKPLAFMGTTLRIVIEDGNQKKELQGEFPSFLSDDRLFIVPKERVQIVRNAVDDADAIADFEEFHNFEADDVDFKISFPDEKALPVGTAYKIWYSSDKVIRPGDRKGKKNHYVHTFDRGKRPASVKGDVLIIGNIEFDRRGLIN